MAAASRAPVPLARRGSRGSRDSVAAHRRLSTPSQPSPAVRACARFAGMSGTTCVATVSCSPPSSSFRRSSTGCSTGAVYALVALGLTLIYGVLHIINFAHGALLTAAMFAAFFAHRLLGLDPYLAALGLTPPFFVLGYALQRFVIGPAAHGEDRNILLVTLGLAVIIENALLYAFRADTRTDQPALRLQRRRGRAGVPERAARDRLRGRARGRAGCCGC